MDAEPAYNTRNLQALRHELGRLNAAALECGLTAPRKIWPEAAPEAGKERARVGSAEQGKVGARRLLTMLERMEGDVSPSVSGTKFTEAGVVRLLAHLDKSRARVQRGNRFRGRLLRFLTRPVSMGIRTSAGVGVERLQLISRYLLEIEAHGWNYVQSSSAARRLKRQSLPSRKDLTAALPIIARSAPEAAWPEPR
jgi:hypothetical protein